MRLKVLSYYKYLPWHTRLFLLIKFATLQSFWLHCSVNLTSLATWSFCVKIKNEANTTFLEQWIVPCLQLHCIHSPTDHVAPSKYWVKSSSWHVISGEERSICIGMYYKKANTLLWKLTLLGINANFKNSLINVNVNYHYFSPKSVTHKAHHFVSVEIFRYHGHCEERSKWPDFSLCLTRTLRDNCTIIICNLELYNVKITLFLFSTNYFVVVVVVVFCFCFCMCVCV